MDNNFHMVDVVIIGGSFGGLSAALLLANSLRRVVIIDAQQRVNAKATHMHNLLCHENASPEIFLDTARIQLKQFSNLRIIKNLVTHIEKDKKLFKVIQADKTITMAKKIILATGINYQLPIIPGIEKFWLQNIFPCPYCSAPELINQSLSVYSTKEEAFNLALIIHKWSKNDFMLLTNGQNYLTPEKEKYLSAIGIQLNKNIISHLTGKPGEYITIHYENGETINRKSIFMHLDVIQQAKKLIDTLGCEYTKDNLLKVDESNMTTINGIYAAGDAISLTQKITCALASGVIAAISIDHELSLEEYD